MYARKAATLVDQAEVICITSSVALENSRRFATTYFLTNQNHLHCSFLRRRFVQETVVVSPNVGCFFRLRLVHSYANEN